MKLETRSTDSLNFVSLKKQDKEDKNEMLLI